MKLSIFQNENGEFNIDNMFFEFETENEIEDAFNDWEKENPEEAAFECAFDAWDAKQAYIKAWKNWKTEDEQKETAQNSIVELIEALQNEKNIIFKSNKNETSFYTTINGVSVRISTHSNDNKGGFNQGSGECYAAADIDASFDLLDFQSQVEKIKAL